VAAMIRTLINDLREWRLPALGLHPVAKLVLVTLFAVIASATANRLVSAQCLSLSSGYCYINYNPCTYNNCV
jgi:hypothetical protein